MNKRLKRLNGELGLEFAPPPFALDTKQVCRQVHDVLVTAEKERKLYMKQKMKFAAVLVAAVIALTGTALAVGPTVWEAINRALGDFAPYAYEVKGISAIDQGIEVKVVSALSDQLNARAYLEVRDLAGDRLGGDNVSVSLNVHTESAVPREGNSFQVNFERISYDSSTRTALYEFLLSRCSDPLLPGAPVTLEIQSFEPGIQTVGYAFLPEELPSDKTLKTKTLSTGETVLTPNQTPVELVEKEYENKNYVPKGMKGVKLSSMGFGTDGLLHIQFQMPEDALEEHCGMGVTIYNGDWGPGMVFYNDRTEVSFYDGKTLYYDIAYPIAPEDMKDVHIEEAHGSFRSEAQIDGEWNLSIPMEASPVREITMNETISGTLVKKLSLTTLSAYVEIEEIPGAYQNYYVPYLPLTIYLTDGTIKTLGRSGWSYKEPIDPEEITGVAIGMWMIPFRENTGGPGYWLAELPE